MTKLQAYKLLQIPSSSTQVEIKRAYRKLALKYHPDINEDNEELFKEILDAYHVLTNKKDPKGVINESRENNEGKIYSKRFNRWFTPEEIQELKDAGIRLSKKREQKKIEREYKALLDSFVYKSFKYVAYVGAIFSLLFFVDFFMPSKGYECVVNTIEIITEVERDPLTNDSELAVYTNLELEESDKTTVDVSLVNDLSSFIKEDAQIIMYKSIIFNNILNVKYEAYSFKNRWSNFFGISVFLGVIYIMLILGCILAKGPTPYYYVLLHGTIILIPLTIIYYLINLYI